MISHAEAWSPKIHLGQSLMRINFLPETGSSQALRDALIVVEAAEKGGALITADIAHSYNKDLFAFLEISAGVILKDVTNLIKAT